MSAPVPYLAAGIDRLMNTGGMRVDRTTSTVLLALLFVTPGLTQGAKRMTQAEKIQAVLDVTEPLASPRGDRIPIRAMGLEGLPADDDTQSRRLLSELDARGIALSARWTPGNVEKSLEAALRLSTLQRELGLEIGINANSCMHRFFDGSEATAHVDADGSPFFDMTFSDNVKMGCPFAMAHRHDAIKAQFTPFLAAYAEAGVTVDFIYLDWEIDGPVEWNGAWEHSKRCARCRENIADIDDFGAFQAALRTLRAEIQREVFTDTVQAYFPDALIGNYAVYPHNGERYWYDYFEEFVEEAPYRLDARAQYRPWFREFGPSGFTFAMPVVYTWYPTFGWYDFDDSDYRWFYNMLLVASNACENTPPDVPIISWLHWHTTAPPDEPDPAVKQLSAEAYQELIWHMLLRGCDGLMNWCMQEETPTEIRLIQEVYAASLEYKDFLDLGTPVTFHVPTRPTTVLSGLKLGNKLLVRRTDFSLAPDRPVALSVPMDDAKITVPIPPVLGECQVIDLPWRIARSHLMKQNRVLAKLRANEPALIGWCGSGSPIIAELIATRGFDGMLFDAQHGYWSYNGLLHALGAVGDSETTPIVRVSNNDYGIIGPVMDAGALGVIIPMVNTREQAEKAVASCLDPPEGERSSGGPRRERYGGDYVERVNEEMAVIVMIETKEAVAAVDEIVSVPGISAVLIGPGDLALSLGCSPDVDDEHEACIQRVIAACAAKGVPSGIACSGPEDVIMRAKQGMTFLAGGSDVGWVTAGADTHLEQVRAGL